MKKASGGYTLFELAVSLAIAAVLACAAAASVRSTVETKKLKSQARETVSELESLHLSAMQHGRNIKLTIHPSGYNGYRDGLCFLQKTLPQPLRFAEGSAEHVLFHARGVSSPATLMLNNGRKTCLIIISLRGRVRSRCL